MQYFAEPPQEYDWQSVCVVASHVYEVPALHVPVAPLAPHPPHVLLTVSVFVPQLSLHEPAIVEHAPLLHCAVQQPPAVQAADEALQEHVPQLPPEQYLVHVAG